MSMPRDINVLKEAPASLARSFWFDWCEPGFVPSGYLDIEIPAEDIAAWREMFRQLTFVAEEEDGGAVALWRYRETVLPEDAPIVVLDNEGQLNCVAPTFVDYVVRELISRGEDVTSLRTWLADRGVQTSATFAEVGSRVRFVPDPEARFEALTEGDASELPARDVDPVRIEDLLEMHGTDARVRSFLAAIENPDEPIEIQCDRSGRIATMFLDARNFRVPVTVRGVSLGQLEEDCAVLGAPTWIGSHGKRWDDAHMALHITLDKDRRISRITLMAMSTLPPHLRQ